MEKKIVNPEKLLVMVTDMLAEIQKAGGMVSGFTWNELKNMSAADMLISLAPNDMIIKYNRPGADLEEE